MTADSPASKTNPERMMPASRLIGRFLPYYRPFLNIMLFDLFCAALTTLCDIALPLIIRFITDSAINNIAALTVSKILSLGGIYLALRLIDAAGNFYMSSYGHIMGVYMETAMRRDLFASLQRQSFSFYSETKIGQVMARITSDLFDITEFAHHCPEEFFIAAIKIAASFAILCTMSVPLTLIIFCVLPMMVFTTRFFNKKMRAAFLAGRRQIGEINAQVEDSLLGIRVVKSFANERMEEEKFERGNMDFQRIKKTQYFYMAGFNTSTRLFDGVMYILVVVAGSLFLVRGSVTAADLIAYLLYVTTLLASVRRIVEFTEQFQRGVTGVERFYQLLDAPVEIQDKVGAEEYVDVKGEVRFDNVSFRYSGETKEVLANINLLVKPGENIALVGPSGGGKTTLCSLIPRFYDVTGGAVRVDGHDVRDLRVHSLRRRIGVVQQDVYLFSGTIYDNIVYGRPGATRAQVIEAAKLADAHRFIEQMPAGYDTHIGERGVKLSGGQKQRISIARVFLKNPPILILDEATSALDNESEWVVQQSLERLAKGRTTFTIAHRLTTIRNADVIWVLTDEGIVEQGAHAELIAKRGVYYDLYHQYMEVV
ncbi:MAG: ABC transporter ATP-binding protein/permease [Oscillospiraceae bacterium]|jgi:ATP-binding cassette subfamily B protein|nr:ABC transporter ATP-binding protein/permease [Oscillospiraceae bacterium]